MEKKVVTGLLGIIALVLLTFVIWQQAGELSEQLSSFQIVLQRTGGRLGINDTIVLTESQKVVKDSSLFTSDVNVTETALKSADTRTVRKMLLSADFQSLPREKEYGCKKEQQYTNIDMHTTTLTVKLNGEKKQFTFTCGTGEFSAAPSILKDIVSLVYGITVDTASAANNTITKTCDIGKEYRHTAVDPVTCECPEGYAFKTVARGWGPCAQQGKSDCPASTMKCVKRNGTSAWKRDDCENLESSAARSRCYEKLAITQRNASICNKISDDFQDTRSECYAIVDRLRNGTSCKLITPCAQLFGVK